MLMTKKIEAEITVIKEGLKSIVSRLDEIDKTYAQMPPQAKVELEFPDIDLHELEHGPSFRSYKKDKDGRCSFPEEGKAGWVRLKNVPDNSSILRLVKTMGRNNIDRISLGLFDYRLSKDGEFLQRRPLKKPEESDPHAKMEKNIQNVKDAGQKTFG